MEAKPTIALDVEGTQANVCLPYLNNYNARHGTKLTLKDMTTYDFKGFPASLKEFLRDTEIIWTERWEDIPTTEEYLADKIAKLSANYHVDVATDRGHCSDSIIKWEKYKSVKYEKFIGFGHGYSKSCMINHYDIWIDDSPNLADKVRAAGKVQLLYDQPWNQKVAAKDCRKLNPYFPLEQGSIIRVYNFDDIIKLLI